MLKALQTTRLPTQEDGLKAYHAGARMEVVSQIDLYPTPDLPQDAHLFC